MNNRTEATTHEDVEAEPTPRGELTLQVVAMPADTNADGDIYGGWLMQQMDIAGALTAQRVAKGRVAMVAVDAMAFLRPVRVGAMVSCYSRVITIGRSSIAVMVEVWAAHPTDDNIQKITETQFTFVAIDANRRTRPVPRN